MIIIRAMGGLGNQLQQYALYKKMESLGKDVLMDISWFRNADTQAKMLKPRKLELEYFEGIEYRAADSDEIRSLIGRLWDEKESFTSKARRKLFPAASPYFLESEMYHEQIFEFTDRYLVGYWACENIMRIFWLSYEGKSVSRVAAMRNLTIRTRR